MAGFNYIYQGVTVGSKVCFHQYAISGANIPELAVLHEYVYIPREKTIKKGGIVMQSPCSKELYEQSASLAVLPPDL